MSIDLSHPRYIDLKKRIRENPKDFVAFVGAGLSRPAGLPSWAGLRDVLVKDALSRSDEFAEAERLSFVAMLNGLLQNENLWHCFSRLKRTMTPQSYESVIRNQLTLEQRADCPIAYTRLWQLGIKGIVTFNLDMCAVDAFARERKFAVDSATGSEVAKFSQFLSGTQQFVFQPHGQVHDPSSWVFTEEEYSSLNVSPAYKDFMKALCQTKHLLILGFNPRDFAFRYLIQSALVTATSTGATHYVLINNPESELVDSMGSKGIAVVPYHPQDEAVHSEVVCALDDMIAFLPVDGNAPTVFSGLPSDPNAIPDDATMMQKPLDEMRILLNGAIGSIIPPDRVPTADDIDNLEKFYSDHLGAIHVAWLIDKGNPQYNRLYGYKVVAEKGQGAFGQVYEVVNETDGHQAALKVLLQQRRSDREYLNSFRRGVYSMRILTRRHVRQMVKIIAAYEVPACVFMEYVDGPTLTEAKTHRYLDSIERCLEVLVQIGNVVHSGHGLPEIVLHRDLKPDNVILRSCYSNIDALDVVVLDFDLSWHKGASDLSVVHGARAQGYAAPEQTATGRKPGVSTRHTAVDVFGYGMVAYFLIMGRDPRPNEHKFDDFSESIRKCLLRQYSTSWKCLASYLSDIICKCTRDTQSERIGFSSAVDAFRSAREMLVGAEVRSDNPLLLREVAARVDPMGTFVESDYGRQLVVRSSDQSKEILLQLENVGQQMIMGIKLSKVRTGAEHRYATKYLDKARDKAVAALNVSTFSKTKGDIGQSRLDVFTNCRLPTSVSLETIDEIASRLIDARSELVFD